LFPPTSLCSPPLPMILIHHCLVTLCVQPDISWPHSICYRKWRHFVPPETLAMQFPLSASPENKTFIYTYITVSLNRILYAVSLLSALCILSLLQSQFYRYVSLVAVH
jgi:hypothetical protein